MSNNVDESHPDLIWINILAFLQRKVIASISQCSGRDSSRSPTQWAYKLEASGNLLGHKIESTDMSEQKG
jgi:hypothetical protein